MRHRRLVIRREHLRGLRTRDLARILGGVADSTDCDTGVDCDTVRRSAAPYDCPTDACGTNVCQTFWGPCG